MSFEGGDIPAKFVTGKENLMATQEIVQQLIGVVAKNPSILTSLMQHPYSTVKEVTGQEEVSREQAAEVVTATTALASGQQVDFGNIASMAQQLLGKNDNSVHSLATSLLGNALGGASTQANATGGIPADIISNLAGVAFSGNTARNKSAIDLSDGFGLDDVMGIIGMFLKK